MLFNSYEFIFLFLPIVLIVFFAIGVRGGQTASFAWLVLASLFFYGWWNPIYLILIVGSMTFNYLVGVRLSRQNRLLLIFGVAANLASIAYFKYANFFVDSVNGAVGTSFHLETIVLPLAISFFTFQQIAYLVDAYRGETHEYHFLHYCLFVTFFPQLIAGPIVHHKEVMPQFARSTIHRPHLEHIAVGIAIFSLGLFKKTVLADGVAEYATPIFSAAGHGSSVTFFEAWGATLAYTLQLYFDFSGYSDMAIGGARLFGIRLPYNFDSPYKSLNIIDFWRRWHITLSRFLRDYLYFFLGGNRKGNARRYANLMITMILGGLWHGAGWTFVFWGFLHGLYLCVNHGWHAIKQALAIPRLPGGWIGAWLLTFLCVMVAWVFFRAESFEAAVTLLRAMAGLNGIEMPMQFAGRIGGVESALTSLGIGFDGQFIIHPKTWMTGAPLILFSLAILTMPNTNEIGERCADLFRKRSVLFAAITASAATVAIASLGKISEFLYFQF